MPEIATYGMNNKILCSYSNNIFKLIKLGESISQLYCSMVCSQSRFDPITRLVFKFFIISQIVCFSGHVSTLLEMMSPLIHLCLNNVVSSLFAIYHNMSKINVKALFFMVRFAISEEG